MPTDYTLTDHTQVPDLTRQFVDLSNLAFAEYEGAMQFGHEWGEWYLSRPGTDRRLCQAALAGEEMISQVLVAVQELQIGGELLRCGIIDSVATHPDHRRQGLARLLMDRAHEAMRETARVDAAVLYTNPAGHPCQFYGRLGYLTRARAALITGRRPNGEPSVQPVDPDEHADGLIALLNRYYGDYEGYTPLSSDLWRWHKLTAPDSTGLQVMARLDAGRPTATVSFANVELLLGGERREVSIAYDLAAERLEAGRMAHILAAAPREWVAMIVDERSREMALARELGLDAEMGEVAMVLPFSAQARMALAQQPTVWYPMIESLIGV